MEYTDYTQKDVTSLTDQELDDFLNKIRARFKSKASTNTEAAVGFLQIASLEKATRLSSKVARRALFLSTLSLLVGGLILLVGLANLIFSLR